MFGFFKNGLYFFDCVFYGQLFNNPSPPELAQMLPPDGGYAGWFEGRVVDMLYFPFFSFYWPDWMPIVGGQHFEFFQFIFNIADSAICVGVFLLLFFYSKDVNIALQSLKKEDREDRVFLDGEDVTKEIRSKNVTKNVYFG